MNVFSNSCTKISVLASSTLIVITEHRPKQNIAQRWCYELTFFNKVKHMIVAFVCVICHHTKISKNLDHLVCCFHITILCLVLLMFRKLGSTGAERSLVTSYSCQVSWKSFSCFVTLRKGQMYGRGSTQNLSSQDERF